MSFDPSTGLYTSKYADIPIPTNESIYTFLFSPSSSTSPHHEHDPKANDKPLLISSSEPYSLTRTQAKERTDAVAGVFWKLFGVGEDDVVAVYSPNEVDYGPVCWATHRLGAVVSPANPGYGRGELEYQIETVSKHHPVKLLLVSPTPACLSVIKDLRFPRDRIVLISGPSLPEHGLKSLNDLVSECKGKIKETEIPLRKFKEGEAQTKLAFLSFSSGTTGLPKAVSIPHVSVIANILQVSDIRKLDHRLTDEDKALAVLPFYHIYGLVVILHCNFYNSTPIVIMRQFTLEGMLQAISHHRLSYLFLVPPQLVLMAKSPLTDKYDLSCAKFVMTGAAPLTDEIALNFKKKFPNVFCGQGYGMTETCTVITYPHPLRPVSASAGVLVCNITCKVVSSETGKLCKPYERGELWSKSPSNAINYLGNQKATAETFDDEGFVHTGDEVYFCDEGNLYVTDRIKELIKSKGYQVAPAELEGHLLGHPDVMDAGVIGVHDDYAGEVAKAFVVLTPNAKELASKSIDADEEMKRSIKKHVSDHKTRYKHLDGGVAFVEAIPKNPSGKILRRLLREMQKRGERKSKL
ncbi:phenylacetyl-CoA ligase [Atractiella rhizophila]|nr:phenylacetyl-CoA ligase [Atractiella rhizophila]